MMIVILFMIWYYQNYIKLKIMKPIDKVKAYLRLQRMTEKMNDRRTFTNSVYKAIKQRPLVERSAIINDLKMINEMELRRDYNDYQEKFNQVETALDNSKFNLIN